LRAHFGEQIFRDAEHLRRSDDWLSPLRAAITSSDVLLALIGSDWLDQHDESGRRRLEDGNDWVRVEIATALERGIVVVPILLPGALPPLPERLPDNLKPFASCPARHFSADRWEEDVQGLIEYLQSGGIGRDVDLIELSSCPRLRLRRTLEGHRGGTSGVAFAPDSFTVVSCGGAPAGTALRTALPIEEVLRGDPTVRLWHAADGAPVRVLQDGDKSATAVSFSVDGNMVAAGYQDGRLVLWRTSDGNMLAATDAHEHWLTDLSFSPGGDVVATGGGDGAIRLWRAADGAPLREIARIGTSVARLAFSPEGSSLAAVAKHKCILIRADSGAQVARIRSPLDRIWQRKRIRAVAFAPDGRILAIGDETGTVSLWRLPNAEFVATLAPEETGGEVDWTNTVAFSSRGDLLAVGYRSGNVRFWDHAAGRHVADLRAARAAVSGLAFSPDGTMLATSSWDATVRLWGI
jgi:WD40 repeat protein